MRFRGKSQHRECSTCVRHRTMVRLLSSHLRARAKQLHLFHCHLKHQYNDRCLYWEYRGFSRLKAGLVCCICDGMDQAKFEIPRSAIMKGKEFSTFQKVKLHVSCAIMHGRFCLFTVGLPNVKKDGNLSVELLAHALTLLKRQGQNLASTQLFLQHDNTCREFKNVHGMRFCAAQVYSKNLDRISCNYMRSGHTHEDIDQRFGSLSKHMLKYRDLQTPQDVKNAIMSWLSAAKMPFEGERHCVFLNNPRDWSLDKFQNLL